MKIVLLYLVGITTLLGCTNSHVDNKKKTEKKPYLFEKIDAFEKENTDLGKNEILTKKLNLILLDSLGIWLKDSLAFKRLPLTITELSEVTDNGKLISIARGDLSLRYSNTNNKINLRAVLLLNPEHVGKIKSGDEYIVNCKLNKVLLEPSGYIESALPAYDLGAFNLQLDSILK